MGTLVGLDLSITASGVSVLTPGAPPRVGVIGSAPKGWASTLAGRWGRIEKIERDLLAFIGDDLEAGDVRFAIEAPTYGAHLQGSQHDRAGSWWNVVSSLLLLGPVTEFSPTAVKSFATGKGNASKAEMMARAAQEFPGTDFRDDNGCDALWIGAALEYRLDPDTGRVARTKHRDKTAAGLPL